MKIPNFRLRWMLGAFAIVATLWSLTMTSPSSQAKDGEAEANAEASGKAKDSQWGPDAPPYKRKSIRELRKTLTPIQFSVTQQADTEKAFTGSYWDNTQDGVYSCIVCGLPLFDSTTKYKSGTGWPSFWQPIGEKNVGTKTDWKMLYPRTEVHCKRCKAHLGHVFRDGPQPTGLRYCMNGASLNFQIREASSEEQRPAKTKE